MFRKKHQAAAPSRWSVLLGVLCVALVLLTGALGVTHHHALNSGSHADCGLCASAHTVLRDAIAPLQIPLAHVASTVSASLPPARSRELSRFSLFTRPPPACASLS